MSEKRAVFEGPFRVIVYHNMGQWEQEWSLGDDDLEFVVEEETLVIGVQVCYPDGSLAGAMHYGAHIAEPTQTVKVNLDEMRRAIREVAIHNGWIQEALENGQDDGGEGRGLGSGDPDGTGDRSEEDSGVEPDSDLRAAQLHDGDSGDPRP